MKTRIFSGSSHRLLVERICDRLGQKPAQADLKKFSNGETSVEIKTSVRDQDVFIVQSGSAEINDSVMEMLIMISACKGGSARSITAVVPYFPYSRQSKKKTHRGAITARMIANLMKVAGVNHVITIDLHASQMQGFFQCPVDNLIAEPLIAKWIKLNVSDWPEAVVVSKNPGGTKRVTSLADALKLSFGIVTTDRRRPTMPLSMYNSTIFETLGGDSSHDRRSLQDEDEEADAKVYPEAQLASTSKADFASVPSSPRRDQQPHKQNQARNRGYSNLRSGPQTRSINGAGNTEITSSPLAHSTHIDSAETSQPAPYGLRRVTTVPGVLQPTTDEDGYEEAGGDDDGDELARDVITGRLIHGHIVDDDAPSPNASIGSASVRGTRSQRQSSGGDEDSPDLMTQSFVSVASSRGNVGHALGGTGDAAHSDEEEEEALRNPEIEHTITLVGNVRDKPVIIVDDMFDKSASWIAAAETVVKRGGATKVYCIATHGLFGGDCLHELDMCDEIDAIVVTNSFPIPAEKIRGVKKLHVLDVSGLLAEAIRRNHHGESITQLYQHFE